MADRPGEADAPAIRYALQWIVNEIILDPHEEIAMYRAALDELDRLTARLSEAERRNALVDELGTVASLTKALHAVKTRLSEAEHERDELERIAYESNEREKEKEARLSDYEQALRLADEALAKHDEWCGYKADSPGNGVYSRARTAIHAALSGRPKQRRVTCHIQKEEL